MKTYQFEARGVTPLLLDHDNITEAEKLEVWRNDPANKNKSKRGDDRSPPWSWKRCLPYHSGKVAMPSDYLATCLRQAGALIILKGQTTYKSATQSGILFTDPAFPLEVGGDEIESQSIVDIEGDFDEQCEKFESLCKGNAVLDVRRAKPQQQKHVRVRPRFENWGFAGQLHVVADEITTDILEQLFTLAGDKKGLGNWRPSAPKSPGPYGRFTAEILEV